MKLMVKNNLSTSEKRTAEVNRGGDSAYAVPVLGGAHGGGRAKGKEQKLMISRVLWPPQASAVLPALCVWGWLRPSQKDGQAQELMTQAEAWPLSRPNGLTE